MPVVNMSGSTLIFPNGELKIDAFLQFITSTEVAKNSPHVRVMTTSYMRWIRDGIFKVDEDTLYVLEAGQYMSAILMTEYPKINFAYPYFRDRDWDEGTVSALCIHSSVDAEAWVKKWGDLLSNLFIPE